MNAMISIKMNSSDGYRVGELLSKINYFITL